MDISEGQAESVANMEDGDKQVTQLQQPIAKVALRLAVASAIGLIAGIFAVGMVDALLPISILNFSPKINIETLLSLGVGNAIAGLALGLAQWIVLRKYMKNAIWWAWATCLGWGLVGTVMVYLEAKIGLNFYRNLATEIAWDSIKGLVGGMLIGLVQWRAINPRRLRSMLWPLINGLCVCITGGLFSAVIRVTNLLNSSLDGNLSMMIITGLTQAILVGVVQGVSIAWVIRSASVEQAEISYYLTLRSNILQHRLPPYED